MEFFSGLKLTKLGDKFSRGNSCESVINTYDIFLSPTGEDGVHPAVQQGGRFPPLLHSAACQEEGWRRLSRGL